MSGAQRHGEHRSCCRSRAALARVSAAALGVVLGVSLAGCGDYDPETGASAGASSGPTMSAGQLGTAGQPGAMNGAAGSAGQAAVGGAGGSAGQAALGGSSSGGDSGSSSDVAPVEADCEAVQPCGGEVVGTWIAAGSCLPVSGNADISGFGLGCTTAPVTGTLAVAGRWTANADGTFTDATTTSGESLITLPPECLNVSGTITTCDRLGGALQALGYAEVTCGDAASGGGCACSARVDQAGGLAIVALGAASGGTYTTADGVLTTSAGSSTNAYAYCVTENTLLLTPRATGTTGMLTGTIVLVKP